MTCRNSGRFNHKRNHYFFKSTEKKSDRFQVIPVIRVTGFSLLNFYKYLISAERVQIVSVGFMIYICTVIKIFRPIFTAAGRIILLASCPGPIFDFGQSK